MSSSSVNRRLAKAIAALEEVPDLLTRLEAVRQARESLEQLEGETARQAREAGATWSRIGGLYGVSKQAAQQRFKSRPKPASAEDVVPPVEPVLKEDPPATEVGKD